MTTSEPQQPLVCASLHLPPDPQPFLRIHEISLYIFLPNLEHLRDDLRATPDIDPETFKSFRESLRVLTSQLHTVFRVPQLAQEVAERYQKILQALEEKKPTQKSLYEVNLGAGAAVLYTKEAQKATSIFRGEFERAVERVRTTIDASHKSSLTSAKNMQSVSEVLTAINEFGGLIQQCQDQFEELEKQTENKDLIDSDPPSEEEIQLMRAKWQTFLEKMDGLARQGIEIANEISMPLSGGPRYISESPKTSQKVPLWRALFQRQDKRDLVPSRNLLETPTRPTDPNATVTTRDDSREVTTNVINPVDTMERLPAPENTAVPGTTKSDGQPEAQLKAPFWRRIFRRTNNSSLEDVSGRVEASNDAPDATTPPKVTFWRKFFRWVTRFQLRHRDRVQT